MLLIIRSAAHTQPPPSRALRGWQARLEHIPHAVYQGEGGAWASHSAGQGSACGALLRHPNRYAHATPPSPLAAAGRGCKASPASIYPAISLPSSACLVASPPLACTGCVMPAIKPLAAGHHPPRPTLQQHRSPCPCWEPQQEGRPPLARQMRQQYQRTRNLHVVRDSVLSVPRSLPACLPRLDRSRACGRDCRMLPALKIIAAANSSIKLLQRLPRAIGPPRA